MKLIGYILVIAIVSICSCAPANTSKTDARDIEDPNELSTTYLSLADYLKRVPGVTVTPQGGSYRVMIRGMSSVSGSNEPLYVVNREQYNSYDAAASAVDPNDIDRVTVLKDVASTSSYGMRGANGVIVIRLKK